MRDYNVSFICNCILFAFVLYGAQNGIFHTQCMEIQIYLFIFYLAVPSVFQTV
jgi:hypothetical protein